MLITKEEIQNYIPQRPPFVMIDNLIEASAEYFKTDFTILPDNIFLERHALREFALIENIAQSTSAGLAITSQYKGTSKPDGYLGGISRLKLYELPALGDTIYTVVQVLARFENMFLVKGVNYLRKKTLMECELKLAGI
jgi:3-hydroxyacyl-[acyl-carrier-protein] dehydratase